MLGDTENDEEALSGTVERRPTESAAPGFSGGYGAGGLLSASRSDPARLRVFIEGKMVEFELSLVERKPRAEEDEDVDEEEEENR